MSTDKDDFFVGLGLWRRNEWPPFFSHAPIAYCRSAFYLYLLYLVQPWRCGMTSQPIVGPRWKNWKKLGKSGEIVKDSLINECVTSIFVGRRRLIKGCFSAGRI